jgi:hypothetical protein
MSARAEGSPQDRSRANRQKADARSLALREAINETDR